ncbi:glutathione S-transferase family protein [Roseixanthobacter pseudopolyaromaticivorans]|uniref:glutathione S-transferase family protein n=1 Tax=Xanthobacteraceae TaxID=335928 RepID=UPI00372CC751
MKLYHRPLSGHSHRVRLFLSLIGQTADFVVVGPGENRQAEFLKLNPFGQVPVLDDQGLVVSDSISILIYLAKKFGRHDWLPEAASEAAAVQRWLSVAANEIANGPCAARLITLFGATLDAEGAISRAHRVLALVDLALAGREWIALDHPTLADVALYSYIAHAPEGNVDLEEYANIGLWLLRMEALPGFLAMPRSSVGLNAVA